MSDGSQDIFGSQGWEASISSPSSASSSRPSQPSQPSQVPKAYFCERCKTEFKSEKKFTKDKLLHIQQDSISRVSEEHLYAASIIIAEEVCLSMVNDPAISDFGVKRKTYCQTVIQKLKTLEWSLYVKLIGDKFIPILFGRVHVMPQRQYEMNLISFNKILGVNSSSSDLLSHLKKVSDCDPSIIKNFNFRFCSEIFKKLQAELFKKMRGPQDNQSTVSHENITINQEERQVILYSVGSIFRSLLKKDKHVSRKSPWVKRCKCISKKFLFEDEETCSLAYLQCKAWFDERNRGGLIAINETVFNFLIKVETMLRLHFLKEQSLDTVHYTIVLEELFDLRNSDMLSTWFSLTESSLTESDSIVLLKELLKEFVALSTSAEADRRLRILEGQNRLRKVALRTDLKRNK